MGSSELTPLQVRQCDLNYTVAFEPPLFELSSRWAELQTAIYKQLSRFKLRLSDIKIESSSGNPGDMVIACWLFDYGVIARYRLDRIELWSNRQIAAQETLAAELVKQSLQVVRDVSSGVRLASHTITAAVHGSFANAADVRTRIASYLRMPPDGPLAFAPAGVSFSSELPSGAGRGTIVLEISSVLPDAIFLRVTSEHPGTLAEVAALQHAIQFFRGSATGLGLDIIWQPQ